MKYINESYKSWRILNEARSRLFQNGEVERFIEDNQDTYHLWKVEVIERKTPNEKGIVIETSSDDYYGLSSAEIYIHLIKESPDFIGKDMEDAWEEIGQGLWRIDGVYINLIDTKPNIVEDIDASQHDDGFGKPDEHYQVKIEAKYAHKINNTEGLHDMLSSNWNMEGTVILPHGIHNVEYTQDWVEFRTTKNIKDNEKA